MKSVKFGIVLLALVGLAACGKSENSGSDKAAAGKTDKATSVASSGGTCELVSTKDGKPLPIKVTSKDTPEAKEFLSTCIDPYTKKYEADPEAAKAGDRKSTRLNSSH